MKRLTVVLLSLLLLSCSGYNHKTSKNDLNQLVDLMTGSFSSLKQSQTDKAYFDIRLEMV
ncbi:MAG: hypothetical protein AB8B80_09235 [Marinicellaceae bacterium]